MSTGPLDPQSLAALNPGALWLTPLASVAIDDEEYIRPASLHEQPPWVRDAALVSQRARAALERVRIVLVDTLRYWDHQCHSIAIGNASISIDASGSYRRR